MTPADTVRATGQRLSGIRTDVDRLKSFADLRLWKGEPPFAFGGPSNKAFETLANVCFTVVCLRAGIVVPGRGRRRASRAKPAISMASVSTDSGRANTAISVEVSTDAGQAKAATKAEVSTDSPSVPHPGRAPSASACEPYRELIVDALRRGRNAMAIWQDLVDDHGFTARYASLRRFVGTLRGTSSPEARVVITTAPGEEGQVDYGEGPMVRHPDTGKYRRTRLFVLTLGYSRKAVRLLVWQSSTQIWAELHERAFRRLGGTVRVIVLDNLKEGVLTPDIYDPALNPLYRDVLAHYGVVALPSRNRNHAGIRGDRHRCRGRRSARLHHRGDSSAA